MCLRVPLPEVGSHLRSTANRMMSRRPSQNCGTDRPSRLSTTVVRSGDAVRLERRQNTERNRQGDGERHARADEIKRHRQPFKHDLGDRPMLPQALAEIEAGDIGEEIEKIGVERTIESEAAGRTGHVETAELSIGRIAATGSPITRVTTKTTIVTPSTT